MKKPHSFLIFMALGIVLWAAAIVLYRPVPREATQETTPAPLPVPSDVAVMDRFDSFISEALSNAKASIPPPVFSIPAEALKAPEPDPDRFGQAADPSELQWLLDEAVELLGWQPALFSTQIETYHKSQVDYYLDKTIFAVTWQQVIDNFVYTISEIKIAHPSQFRRYLPEGVYEHRSLYTTSVMSQLTNAVVASSGDYYRARVNGITTYQGQVYRFHSANFVDTCFVDDRGDLILMPAGSFDSQEAVQQFVDENSISFSLAFGPILVNNGQQCEPDSYALGEANGNFTRAAICQMGELHYLLVMANGDGKHWDAPTIHTFADRIAEFGCEKAYTLDGGHTATLVMNDQLINPVLFGYQRAISDMIYFGTALPE